MQFAQIYDEVQPPSVAGEPLDIRAFPGKWINSNPDTSGIARLTVAVEEGKLSLQVFAIGPDGLVDWGAAPLNIFAAGPASQTGAGFTCVFDFGFAETRLQGMIMKGLLVLAQFHRFKDESGRTGYFVREYFALEHGRF